jgi:peptide/bleomycin uptake transporter
LDTNNVRFIFPRPKLFFLSAIVWTTLAMAFWYGFAGNLIGSSRPGKARCEL